MIINLTQHPASPQQRAAGVVDLPVEASALLKSALDFQALADCEAQEIQRRAEAIAEIAVHNGLGNDDGEDPVPAQAMIGGAMWLMPHLAAELEARGVEPVFAFSKRVAVETTTPDGRVQKTADFLHEGWVSASIPRAAGATPVGFRYPDLAVFRHNEIRFCATKMENRNMIKCLAYRLIGVLLLGFCGTTWAWMLGAFASLPTAGLGVNSARWVAPGILAMPGTLAAIAGLVGFLFVLGVFPLPQADGNDAA